jgi:hypothetical protein
VSPGTDRLIQILDTTRRASHCRDCGRPIEWATLAGKGKFVPIEPNPLVLNYVRNPETHVRFLVISANNLHFTRCTKRKERPERLRRFGGSHRP